jgi:hypothetical protein
VENFADRCDAAMLEGWGERGQEVMAQPVKRRIAAIVRPPAPAANWPAQATTTQLADGLFPVAVPDTRRR